MNETLDLSPDEMREIGRRVIDALVEHLTTLREQPVGAKGDPAALLASFNEPPPEHGAPFAELLARVERDALRNTLHLNHPRFFGFVPSPGNFIGAMADALAAGYNVFAGTWIGGSGAAAMELATISWLRQLCGFPETAGGLFVSGGSMANLTGLAAARHSKLGERFADAVIYCSDQAHSSLLKGIRLLGFRADQICKLKSDAEFRMRVAGLKEAIAADRAAGKRPFCVVASAGTINTGAVDPLAEIADVCRDRDLWMHVDGAYGAAAVLCECGRALLGGMERADSLSLDPHKWLFQPIETGCLLVRNRDCLRAAFEIMPEYLQDTRQNAEFNFSDHGLQLTRSFRALKLWLSIQYFGLASFRAAIERGFALAEFAEQCLRGRPGWEIVTRAQMGIVCFRYREAGDEAHAKLVQILLRDGFALATSTVLRGRAALRMCLINPRTTEADIEESLARLDGFALTLVR